jgi:hypothetical protein
MLNSRKQGSRVNRWLLAISQYSFKAEYIKGDSNTIADMMSRLVPIREEANEREHEEDRALLKAIGECYAITRRQMANLNNSRARRGRPRKQRTAANNSNSSNNNNNSGDAERKENLTSRITTRNNRLTDEEKQDALLARALAEGERKDAGLVNTENNSNAVDRNDNDADSDGDNEDEIIEVESSDLFNPLGSVEWPTLEQIKDSQIKDEIYGIIHYNAKEFGPITLGSKLKRDESSSGQLEENLIKAQFVIDQNASDSIFYIDRESGLLMKMGANKGNCYVIPKTLRQLVIQYYHNRGHYATDRTYNALVNSFWWIHMRSDIEKFINNCSICRSTNVRGATGISERRTIQQTIEPGSSWHLDFIGPLPRAKRFGAQYVLVAIDEASGYVEVKAVANTTGTVVQSGVLELMYRWGTPKQLRCDNGPGFNSLTFQRWVKELGIKLLLAPAYHPQSNGKVERANKTLKQTLQRAVNELGLSMACEWLDVLVPSVSAMNMAPSTALGSIYSPFVVMHGRSPSSIVDAKWGSPEEGDVDHWLLKTRIKMQAAKHVMKQLRQQAAAKLDQINSELKGKRAIYKAGDRVLVRDKTERTLAQRMVSQGHTNPFTSTQSNWRRGTIERANSDNNGTNGNDPIVYTVMLDKDSSILRGQGRPKKERITVHADHLQLLPAHSLI